MKARFEVSTTGMRELQAGREPWQLAKELVSNAWDESTTLCRVTLVSVTPRQATITVYDDGKGFTDIADSWTLMGHTPKRLNPHVRGRFNIGEKEILSIAINATIYTAGKVITFPKTGGRQVRKNTTNSTGTIIKCLMPWGIRQVEGIVEKLKTLLPPRGIQYTVNDELVPYKKPTQIVEVTLDTVLQASLNEPMRPTRRKTTIELHPKENGMLYEMGIPIQPLECPYLVDVIQKVPMPPNRDVVRDSYLQDIYTTVLNATADTLNNGQISDTWVRTAIEDKEIQTEAVKTIMDKRYGDKVALWSSDPRANERALESGYELVHGKTLSPTERGAMQSVGLQHSSSIFPTNWGTAENFPEDQWTDGMRRTVAYAKRLAIELLGFPITVSMYKMPKSEVVADFIGRRLRFNVSRLGKNWFNSMTSSVTSLLLHEFAHTDGTGHNWEYQRRLEELAGKAVHLALDKPDIFIDREDNR